jgi:Uncharacterized protein conserved in bacteria (DUF2237)
MLRDDSNNGAGRRRAPRNVLGEPLEACSIKPMTGFYRDGCCNTGREDVGIRSRQDFSAGLSVHLHGAAVVNGEPVVYGGLGGEPAITLH